MNPDILNLLRKLGFRGTYAGFYYLAYGITLAMEDNSYLRRLTTGLYPAIGARYGVSAACVERSLRTLLAAFWKHGNVALLEEVVGYPVPAGTCTGAFIDILTSYLTLQ